MAKIGIFTGTFDPIHEGHIAFITAAMQQCQLDSMIVIPENTPRAKQNVSAVHHRIQMMQRAGLPPSVHIRSAPSAQVTMKDVVALTQAGDELYLMLGTDVALTLKTWPEFSQIKQNMRFIIGTRSDADATRIHTLMAHLEVAPERYTCIKTAHWAASSSKVRMTRHHTVPAINEYIQQHNLYTV